MLRERANRSYFQTKNTIGLGEAGRELLPSQNPIWQLHCQVVSRNQSGPEIKAEKDLAITCNMAEASNGAAARRIERSILR